MMIAPMITSPPTVAASMISSPMIIMSPVDRSASSTSGAPIMFKSCVVKTSPIEIGPVLSFENRAIMCIVEPVPVMTVPGRIGIIGISRIISFINDNRRWRNANADIHMNLRIS